MLNLLMIKLVIVLRVIFQNLELYIWNIGRRQDAAALIITTYD